jgi:hypothetical protein
MFTTAPLCVFLECAKKVTPACNYTCSFPTPNFVESCTLHVRNVPRNSPRNFLLSLSSLSLFPLYTQPPVQNVRMWQLSALCPKAEQESELSWEFVLFFSELVGLTTARCCRCCCYWTAHLQRLQRNLCVIVPLAWLLW